VQVPQNEHLRKMAGGVATDYRYVFAAFRHRRTASLRDGRLEVQNFTLRIWPWGQAAPKDGLGVSG
jgi:hypothetical protein